jgi:hypothetical protein
MWFSLQDVIGNGRESRSRNGSKRLNRDPGTVERNKHYIVTLTTYASLLITTHALPYSRRCNLFLYPGMYLRFRNNTPSSPWDSVQTSLPTSQASVSSRGYARSSSTALEYTSCWRRELSKSSASMVARANGIP